jgi:Flp pilus assembly protein TadG
VEFALVVGLFAFILYGLVAFGTALATKQRVTSAVADGARAAVGAADITAASSQAQARVQAKLGLTGYTATYLPDTTNCAAPAECIKVTVIYALPPSPGLGLVTPPATTSSAVVQYK